MKAFITKYALTKGIQEVDDAECNDKYPNMISVNSLGTFACFHGEGKDWHRTRDAACNRADAMRIKKIANLKKQIAMLNEMTF